MTWTWFTECAIGLDLNERLAVAVLVTSSTLIGPIRFDIRQIESVSRQDDNDDDALIRMILSRFPPGYPVICVSRGLVSQVIGSNRERSRGGTFTVGNRATSSNVTGLPSDLADTLKPIRDAGGDIMRNRAGLITADLGATRKRIAAINTLPDHVESCPGSVSEIDAIAAMTDLANSGLRLIITSDSARCTWIAADGDRVPACRTGIPELLHDFEEHAIEDVRRLFPDRTPSLIRELPEMARPAGAAIAWLRTGADCLLQPVGDAGQSPPDAFPVTPVVRRSALLVRSTVLVFLFCILGIGFNLTMSKYGEIDALHHQAETSLHTAGEAIRLPGIAVNPSGIDGLYCHLYLADIAEAVSATGVSLNDIRLTINRMDIQGYGDDITGIDTFSHRLVESLGDHGAAVQSPVTTRDSAGRLQFRVAAIWGDAR